jgi:hypothetical protein
MNNQGSESNEVKTVPPNWLWIGIRLGFVALVVVGVGLVVAVATGVADPQPVGRLKWEDQFTGTQRWESFGSGVAFKDGALEIGVGANAVGGAVTQVNDKDFSFEVAGGQVTGEVGAAYGIVFNYLDPQHYTAVLINGNSYVEVVGADGQQFLDWQEWPNILLNYEANRLRVDVQNGQALIRINDEVLTTIPATSGGVGVLARGSAVDQSVRFGWAKYWSR